MWRSNALRTNYEALYRTLYWSIISYTSCVYNIIMCVVLLRDTSRRMVMTMCTFPVRIYFEWISCDLRPTYTKVTNFVHRPPALYSWAGTHYYDTIYIMYNINVDWSYTYDASVRLEWLQSVVSRAFGVNCFCRYTYKTRRTYIPTLLVFVNVQKY